MLKVKGLVGKIKKNAQRKKREFATSNILLIGRTTRKRNRKIIIPNKTSETQRNEGAINIEYKT